jgi:hyperosmotically inducible periplasmic protein
MQKLFILGMLSLALVSCERHDKPYNNSTATDVDADNTGVNVRDRDMNTRTSGDQSESENDRLITQRIRKIVVADDTLSTNAKNIKIVTINGVVTLRGPVATIQEKNAIERKLSDVQGVKSVDNQLDVTGNK